MDIEALCERTLPGGCARWSGALVRLPEGGVRLELVAQGPGLRQVVWPGFEALVLGQPRPEQAPSAREADPDPVHALLDAFEDGGVSALRRVEGGWALVHWDQEAAELHLAVDRLARVPVFVTECPDGWRFAGDPDELAALTGAAADPERLRAIATGARLPAGSSVYAAIRELPPGEHLRIRAGGALPAQLHGGVHGGWRLEKRERRPVVLVAGEFAERLKSALRVLGEQGELCLLAENLTETALAAAALAQLPGPRSRLLWVPGWSAGRREDWDRVSTHFGLELIEAGESTAALGTAATRRAWLERQPGLRRLAAALTGLRAGAGRPLILVSARGFDLALPPAALPLFDARAWAALRDPPAPAVAAIGAELAAALTGQWRPPLAAALDGLPWQLAWPMLDETVAHFLANLPTRMRRGYPWSIDFRRRILRELLPADLRRPNSGASGAATLESATRT